MKQNIRNWILLLLTLFSFHLLHAQGTGLILEDEVYETIPEVPLSFATGKNERLPSKYSLKQHCPAVINQGQVGSCIGWSMAYGAFTIMKAQEEGWTDEKQITDNAFSAMYVYNQVKLGDCGQGSLFSTSLKLLQSEGDCLSKDFDYPLDDCNRIPEQEHKIAAEQAKYEVQDYYTLFKNADKENIKKDKVKVSISENKPVIIGMLIRENFKNLTKEDKYWNPDAGDKTSAGGHAMVIVGYNDDKNAFEVMNSWGKEWGNDGYFWLKYDDFAKYCVYGYQLSIKKKYEETIVHNATERSIVINDNQVRAEFVFRYPLYNETTDELLLSEVETTFNGNYYELKNDDWAKNQRFQLLSRGIKKGQYVYVFSIDPDNQSRIHWPRNEKYNQKFQKINESALVPYDNVEIIIPGKDKQMVKDKVGVDFLFVLYSDKPINDLINHVEEIKKHQFDYVEGLKKTFGNDLISNKNVHYEKNQMKFITNSFSEGYIVPLVLKVETRD